MEKSISFTEQEANALIGLLDDAVRAKGLNAAQNALVLVTKVQSAFAESEPVPKEELSSDE